MPDFQFLQNPVSKNWVISAPRRAKRPDIARGSEPICPFCVGREGDEQELFRISAKGTNETQETNAPIPPVSSVSSVPSVSSSSSWLVRVLPNKFPFASIHEVIIHSPDHHQNFGELPFQQVELILKTYRHRYNEHAHKGQVYIFHNHGVKGGESLPHPHTQLVVIPQEMTIEIPMMNPDCLNGVEHPVVQTSHFILTCPLSSQWPDEVWIAPQKQGRLFGEITDEEVADLADTLTRLVHILDLRHGKEFPYNFYIYPGGNWYLRLIPREKSLGGFEVGTNVFVNTQDPKETIAFIQQHFTDPDIEKIVNEHQADYEKNV